MDIKFKFVILVFIVTSSAPKTTGQKAWPDEEETSEFWNNKAQEELKVALETQNLNQLVAKNVIMFLGDGMGLPTVTAGRILKGQLQGQSGEEFVLAMDKLPHVGMSKTYSVDKQVSDSAATATAYLCGVKSMDGTAGLNGGVVRGNCASSKDREVQSILVDSYLEGKSTGIVTTTRINHASPSGTYAHTADRRWYGDADLPQEAKDNGCKDIAQQFYDNSHMFTVALGGGRKYFQSRDTSDPEYPSRSNSRTDGQDLIQKWKEGGNGETRTYVWNKEQFDDVDPVTTDKLLGLFEDSDMKFEIDRVGDAGDPSNDEPSITEMTEKAIQMLQKNSKGYFLFVEGGRIDHGHHDSSATEALHDMVAFDDAIARAVEMTSSGDTLIVVTADHSHTMSLGGYTYRGNPIFGLAPSNTDFSLANDDKPYTAILYGNGPGYQGLTSTGRDNITETNTAGRLYLQQSSVPLPSETHGGDDVPIMASGPMAHLFHGIHEQNYIAHAMRYISCVGSNKDHCSNVASASETDDSSVAASFLGMDLTTTDATVALYVQFVLVLCLAAFCVFLGFLVARSKSVAQNTVEMTRRENTYTSKI